MYVPGLSFEEEVKQSTTIPWGHDRCISLFIQPVAAVWSSKKNSIQASQLSFGLHFSLLIKMALICQISDFFYYKMARFLLPGSSK
jgi:hypothetical protein